MREVALWLEPQDCSCSLRDTPSTGTSLKGSFVRTIVLALCSSIVSFCEVISLFNLATLNTNSPDRITIRRSIAK